MDENEPEFHRKIIMSDKAHFHLGGYVNKQNRRIWVSENQKMIFEKPLYPRRVTVWCGFLTGGIIRPYFFLNEAGDSVSVNGLRYRIIIYKFLLPESEDMDMDGVYFQQDSATCHTSRETIGLLREMFPGRVISRNGDCNWPPRPWDLTPSDFFLWGYVKDKVYADAPQSIQEIEEKIRAVIDEVEL